MILGFVLKKKKKKRFNIFGVMKNLSIGSGCSYTMRLSVITLLPLVTLKEHKIYLGR